MRHQLSGDYRHGRRRDLNKRHHELAFVFCTKSPLCQSTKNLRNQPFISRPSKTVVGLLIQQRGELIDDV
jgi:hypothetical protein